MSKESVFTMKLEPELREQFMAEAAAVDRPASQVVRELMREFIQRQHEAQDHDAFLQRKVATAGSRFVRAVVDPMPKSKANSPHGGPS